MEKNCVCFVADDDVDDGSIYPSCNYDRCCVFVFCVGSTHIAAIAINRKIIIVKTERSFEPRSSAFGGPRILPQRQTENDTYYFLITEMKGITTCTRECTGSERTRAHHTAHTHTNHLCAIQQTATQN